MQRRVVISGLGILSPLGNTLERHWKGLCSGVSGIAPITKFPTHQLKTTFGGELKGLQLENYPFLQHKKMKRFDPFVHYALISAQQAILDAALDLEALDRDALGVIWGTGNGGIGSLQKALLSQSEEQLQLSPYFITNMIHNIAASVISIHFGFRGISFAPVAACSSSHLAIAQAFQYIQAGMAPIILAGGSEATFNRLTFQALASCRALSKHHTDPAAASRPFDKNRDGIVIGEGAGALILEEREHAIRRKAKIYAEITACGISSDAYHITAPDLDGAGAERAMAMALKNAAISAEDIDFISPHATATPKGDLSEMKALSSVFKDSRAAISATKASTGHLLGASGAVEAIGCIKAIQEAFLPPTINTKDLDPAFPSHLQLVGPEGQQKEVVYAMNNSFGFGGHNVVTIFKKHYS